MTDERPALDGERASSEGGREEKAGVVVRVSFFVAREGRQGGDETQDKLPSLRVPDP